MVLGASGPLGLGCAAHRHGHCDRDQERSTRLYDVFQLMSITKQLTTVVVLAVIERSLFSLNTKVSEIIPEFGAKGKQYHLLTHTSGMNPELPLGLSLAAISISRS